MAGKRTVKGMRSSFRPDDRCVANECLREKSALLIALQAQPRPLSIAMNARITKTSMIGLKTNNTTAAGLINPMTTFVAHRLANRSSRLARVCARTSKSLSDGVSASRYQPVESVDTRRS